MSVLVADIVGSTSIAETLGAERSKFLFDDVVRLMRRGGRALRRHGRATDRATASWRSSARRSRTRTTPSGPCGPRSRSTRRSTTTPARSRPLRPRTPRARRRQHRPGRRSGRRCTSARSCYNALGDTVNVAARLQALGDVVIGPTTARQVEPLFELEELGDLELKGKSEMVAAFRVRGSAREAAEHAGAAARRTRGRARGAERGHSTDSSTARGAIVSITGEPGIGKSRLVAEAEERFAGTRPVPRRPRRRLRRARSPTGPSASSSGAGSASASPTPRRASASSCGPQLARALADDAEEAYPFLATPARHGARAGGGAARARLRARRRPAADVRLALPARLRAGRERPLCLVLEDLHWSDEATLALLEELLPATEQTAVVLPARPPQRPRPLLPGSSSTARPGASGARSSSSSWSRFRTRDSRALADADAGGELAGGARAS